MKTTVWMMVVLFIAGSVPMVGQIRAAGPAAAAAPGDVPLPGGGEHKITSILLLTRENHTLLKANDPSTVYVGQRLPLRVEASWATPYVGEVTGGATLAVDDPARAEVDARAVLIAKAAGKVVVTAKYAGFQDKMELNIVDGPEPRALQAAHQTAAQAELKQIATALDRFKSDTGSYPTTQQGLAALVEDPGNHHYLNQLSDDPWGRPYLYRCPGNHGKDYDLLSGGPSGKEDAADAVKLVPAAPPAAPAAAAPAPAEAGGIRGTITKKTGNWMPPVDPKRAKVTPLGGVQVQIFQGDILRAAVASDQDGKYAITLAPGKYKVIIKGGGNADYSGKVEVKDGQWVEIDACDNSQTTQ